MRKETVVVTGASRGIGKAVALKLNNEGYNVIPFGRDSANLEILNATLKINNVDTRFYVGNVEDELFVRNSIKEIEDRYGRVDHLINNAGIAIFEQFVNSTLTQFKKQIDTNLYGVYNFTKAVVNGMIERNYGSIINISSLAGKNGFVGGTMYSSTKHALMGFTKSLMLELRQYNIRVSAVCPGSVATDLIINSKMKPNNIDKILQPEDVADVIWQMLQLPARACVSEIEIRPTNPK